MNDFAALSQRSGAAPYTRPFAMYLDAQDLLKRFRKEFEVPQTTAAAAPAGATGATGAAGATDIVNTAYPRCIYFCGHSLGVLPRRVRDLVQQELDVWATRGVEGHERHPHGRAWIQIHTVVEGQMARLVGAKEGEVVLMNALTVNLHLLLASFYRPVGRRRKILVEKRAFPSDYYAIVSQIEWWGLNPKEEVVEIEGEEGVLTIESIMKVIDTYEEELSVILFPGVQYYTGQVFDIKKVTEYARAKGIIVGWDLAHAVGNIELQLHEWGVDFAVWCTYKYLNSGPGGIGGVFVHERHANNRLRLRGWWGNDEKTRFNMINERFDSIYGAPGYQISNPSVLNVVSLLGSLEVFSKVSMSSIRQKSILLTGYLEYLLLSIGFDNYFTIITPKSPQERGAQLSLRFIEGLAQIVHEKLYSEGVIVDLRKPNVIRVAPVPLYNTFEEVFDFVSILRKILDAYSHNSCSN